MINGGKTLDALCTLSNVFINVIVESVQTVTYIKRLLNADDLALWAGHRIRCFATQSCPVRSLNSATASILGQSGMSESATVHCFSFVRALSSLNLEVWNSLLIKAFIVWKDIGRSMHCKIVIPFSASVSASHSDEESIVGPLFCFSLSAADRVFYIRLSQLFCVSLCFQ
ncbi:unnamed protein product [Rodentolepis nana]|uniref:Secreted protein n=1 Tax=Rodentolepis nana TaxID=102285 RepID=A0A0R3TPA6_RODNA|nr:unnamed protein product [Rodentolepis nana]